VKEGLINDTQAVIYHVRNNAPLEFLTGFTSLINYDTLKP